VHFKISSSGKVALLHNFESTLPTPHVNASLSAQLESLVATKLEETINLAHAALSQAVDEYDEMSLVALVEWANAHALLKGIERGRMEALMLEPAFRYWLQAIIRFSRKPEERHLLMSFAREFSGLVWAAAVGHYDDWSATVRLDYRGGLRALPFKRYIEFGQDRALEIVSLEIETKHATLKFDDGLVVRIANDDIIGGVDSDTPTLEKHGYILNHATRIGRHGLSAYTRDPWLRVQLSGTNQRTTGTLFLGQDEEHYRDENDYSEIVEAEVMIDSVWPEESHDIAIFTRAMVPFRAPTNAHMAFTVSSRQGAMFIGHAPSIPTTEMILHEKAHIKLREIQLLDPILEDPLDESIKVPVPWRPDPRPLPGVLEGLYVFVHVAEFAWRYNEVHGASWAAERYYALMRDLTAARRVIEKRASLTSNGAKFVVAIGNWLDDLSSRRPAP
jgi:HEXXH motif-containing protein